MYKLVNGMDSTQIIVRTNEDGSISIIPIDEANSDYQAYLVWKAEQPTPKAGK